MKLPCSRQVAAPAAVTQCASSINSAPSSDTLRLPSAASLHARNKSWGSGPPSSRTSESGQLDSAASGSDGVVVRCDDGRVVHSSHAVLAIGSVPNTDGLGLDAAGVQTDGGYVTINRHCQSNVAHIYAAGDMSGKLPLSSVASMQGRKVAEHVMGLQKVAHRHLDYDKAASAIFTEP